MKSEALCKTPSGDFKISQKHNVELKGGVRDKAVAEVTKVHIIREGLVWDLGSH